MRRKRLRLTPSKVAGAAGPGAILELEGGDDCSDVMPNGDLWQLTARNLYKILPLASSLLIRAACLPCCAVRNHPNTATYLKPFKPLKRLHAHRFTLCADAASSVWSDSEDEASVNGWLGGSAAERSASAASTPAAASPVPEDCTPEASSEVGLGRRMLFRSVTSCCATCRSAILSPRDAQQILLAQHNSVL